MKKPLGMFALAVVLPTQALAQVSLPSKEEISELASRAGQKVSGFEEALRNARPSLDKIDPNLPKTYQDAASAAHAIIQGIPREWTVSLQPHGSTGDSRRLEPTVAGARPLSRATERLRPSRRDR